MTLIDKAKGRITRDLNRWRYAKVAKRILETAPLMEGQLPFTALSMVHKRDVLPYLVAIKSFARFAHPERVVIVCDPTIGEHERRVFKQHIPHVELRDAGEFFHPSIPIGGTWERLHAITTYTPTSYVVQLDADTICTQPVPEAIDAITHQYGFAIGEENDQRVVSLAETAFRAKPWLEPGCHIQALAESVMNSLPLTGRFYVRGCSGFTSFPKSTTLQSEFLDFSKTMWDKLGTRWSEWGTEQVASNYLVANMAGTRVLPFPKYCTPERITDQIAFMHFIGSMRFSSRMYENASARIIEILRRSAN